MKRFTKLTSEEEGWMCVYVGGARGEEFELKRGLHHGR